MPRAWGESGLRADGGWTRQEGLDLEMSLSLSRGAADKGGFGHMCWWVREGRLGNRWWADSFQKLSARLVSIFSG